MIDVTNYKQFMGIDSFPVFDVKYYTLDLTGDYSYGARAEYDVKTKAHTLMLPRNCGASKFLLFHELTHILDMETLASGEKNHDFCLTGYMEYHASQVELMIMLGADSVKDLLSFSMQDHVEQSDWTFVQYVNNKLNTAQRLIADKNQQTRVDGLNAFFNFLGLKSVCGMFAKDFEETYSYQGIMAKMSSPLFMELRRTYSGWIDDIDKAVAIYSHAVNAIL